MRKLCIYCISYWPVQWWNWSGASLELEFGIVDGTGTYMINDIYMIMRTIDKGWETYVHFFKFAPTFVWKKWLHNIAPVRLSFHSKWLHHMSPCRSLQVHLHPILLLCVFCAFPGRHVQHCAPLIVSCGELPPVYGWVAIRALGRCPGWPHSLEWTVNGPTVAKL